MESFEQELRDLLRWRRFMIRFGRTAEVMDDATLIAHARKMSTVDGVCDHYAGLRDEAARQAKPKNWIVSNPISLEERKQIVKSSRRAQQARQEDRK